MNILAAPPPPPLCPVAGCDSTGTHRFADIGIQTHKSKDGHLTFCDKHLVPMADLYVVYKAVEAEMPQRYLSSPNELFSACWWIPLETLWQWYSDLETVVLPKRREFQRRLKPQISSKATGHQQWIQNLAYLAHVCKESAQRKMAREQELNEQQSARGWDTIAYPRHSQQWRYHAYVNKRSVAWV